MSSGPNRLPPRDLEAEESLLGAMLLSRDALAVGLETVTAEDFYKQAHGDVFNAIASLHARGEPADPVTVSDELRRSDNLERAGGVGVIGSLMAATPATGNAASYGQIIKDMAILRRMIAAAGLITETAYALPEDVSAAVDQAEQLIYDLGRPGTASATRQLDAVIRTVLQQLRDRAEKGNTIDGIPTGWHDLDALLLGLSPGDITIVGARPGMGKSTFAAALAWWAATEGRPVLFASLEMKAEEITKRWLGSVAGVRLQGIRSARLSAEEWDRLDGSVPRFTGVPIHVLDNYGANVSAIAHAGRRIGLEGGLVIVDYAQLITPHSRAGTNRNNEVAEVSRALKVLAGDLGCHILLLSQLSRTLESRGDKRPVLADLRDSGALEQDASNVLFLYRDELYHPDTKDNGVLEVICAKQRNGPTGTIRLAYLAAYGRIANMTTTGGNAP